MWCLGAGVLLCRGNRLLTGSNTRRLRLWEVEAVRGVKPREKVRGGEDRSAAHSPVILPGSHTVHDTQSQFTQSGTPEISCTVSLLIIRCHKVCDYGLVQFYGAFLFF